MRNTNKGLSTLCIPLLTTIIFLAGCEDPGNVGNDFVDKSELVFDTLSIGETTTQHYSGYSGRLSYVNLGHYSDTLFGDITATALLKPSAITSFEEGDSLNAEYSMQLKIALDSTYTYGDTLSTANFNIYEITSEWNGNNYKINDPLVYDESTVIGSFSVGEEKIITVDLTDSWREQFETYVNTSDADSDSLFQYEFKGLAIVADANTNKIIYPRISQTKFLAIRGGAEPDTATFSLRDWAFKLDRGNNSDLSNVSELHSTVESILYTDLSRQFPEIKGKNLIKAELVFFEAAELLENLPPSEIRPEVTNLKIHLGYEIDPEYEFIFGNIDLLGSKRASDNSFRVNITDYVNSFLYGSEESSELYVGIGSNTGLLRSTLLYNETAPEHLRPIIILTFLEDIN